MKKPLRHFLTLLAALATLASPTEGNSAPGDLDPLFQPGQASNGQIESMCLQPDGKIVVGGAFNFFDNTRRHGIARLHPDGSHDLSFDPGNGIEQSGSFSNYHDSVPRVKVIVPQSGNKILIGGRFDEYDGTPKKSLARLDSDGRLDSSFHCALDLFEVSLAAVQDDGKIVVAAGLRSSNRGDPLLARLHADGSVDTSFVPDIQRTVSSEYVECLTIQPDGKILVGLQKNSGSNGEVRIHRLEANGSIDGSFDLDTGHFDYSVNGTPGFNLTVMALQEDGRILVGGHAGIAGTALGQLKRFNENGSYDRSRASFGRWDYPAAIAVQQDGKIVMATSDHMMRLNQDLSTKDSSFTLTDTYNSSGVSIAIQPDGKILLANYLGIWRFEGDQVAIPTPPNDAFVDAELLSGDSGTATGTNVDATGENGEPSHAGNSAQRSSIWYRWFAPSDGTFRADTIGSGFDTTLAIYIGTAVDFLTELVSNDDAHGTRSEVTANVTNGQQYFLAVDGYGSAQGDVALNYEFLPTAPPSITAHPGGGTVNEGDAFELSVSADGTAPFTYQWLLDGSPISGATETTYLIPFAEQADAGTYAVEITNASGSVTSDPAEVVISTSDSAPEDTWSVHYQKADAEFAYYTSIGDTNFAWAFFYFNKALGDFAFHSAHGRHAEATFWFHTWVGAYHYYYFQAIPGSQGAAQAAYQLRYWYAWAYYYYHSKRGEEDKANELFNYWYSEAQAFL